MSVIGYVLEAQQFFNIPPVGCNSKFVHVGYMDKIFKTKRSASDYYDQHNPHMRPLNAHKTWQSDWDTNTRLRYIVRRYYGENRNILAY